MFDKLDTMATWTEFALAAPGLAAAIRAAIHQYGPGLAYLGTVRPDGGPRLHPVSPVVTDDGLFCCLLDTPKRRDLDRDARYALHVYPPDDSDDEAGLRGSARAVTDPIVIQRVSAYARATPAVPWRLYAFDVELAFLVRRPAGRAAAMTQMWQAPPPGGARRVQLTIRPG
jgi:Pyridoxamine 5'-phosphate oxidase